MSSIIGISGAQGQGKSTLINEIIKRLPDEVYSSFPQTARELLSDWGYSLAEVNAYIPLKIRFQEELFLRHESFLAKSQGSFYKICLIERTFADIFNYALTSVGPFNQYSDWLNDYAERCKAAQGKYFSHIVFLSGREYVPENDGVRSTNPHFSALTDHLILHYTKQFAVKESDITHINVADLDERVRTLTEICLKLY